MNKVLMGVVVVLAIAVGGFFILNPYSYNEKQATMVADYKDAQYVIEGQHIKLEDGVAETVAAPGSASKVVTRYFGNEVVTDLNDDRREDIVFLLTQETGGSGIFYYVVAALNTADGYVGSQAVFLGDRIAPQTTHMDEGITSKGTNRQNIIVVNYAVRLPGEPFTVRPTLGKSIWLKLDPATMRFGEVVRNFEGESR